jgi:hypothetical protein
VGYTVDFANPTLTAGFFLGPYLRLINMYVDNMLFLKSWRPMNSATRVE